jgi:hypothetical protein
MDYWGIAALENGKLDGLGYGNKLTNSNCP